MGAIVRGGRKERLELSLVVARRIVTVYSRKLQPSSQILVILVSYVLSRLKSLQVLTGTYSAVFPVLFSLTPNLAMKEWIVQVKMLALLT